MSRDSSDSGECLVAQQGQGGLSSTYEGEWSMSEKHQRHLGRWAAAIVGVLVALKTMIFCVSRLFRFTRHEVETRGSDVAFVLGLAERRRAR